MLRRVREYVEAHNKGDIEHVLSLFTDEVSFVITDVWAKHGKDEIRQLEEWDAELQGSFHLQGCIAEGQEVHCEAVERNKWFDTVGIAEARYGSARFSFNGDRICGIQATMEPTTYAAISETLKSVVDWASEAFPETVRALMPGGEFRYGRSSAQIWLELLAKWRRRHAPQGNG